MDQLDPLDFIDPKWRTAFGRFVETGEAEEDFLDYLNSNPKAQEAVEQAFQKQAAALSDLAKVMAVSLGGDDPSHPISSTRQSSLLQRSINYVGPAALVACALLAALAVRQAGVVRHSERELALAEGASNRQAEAFNVELAGLRAERDRLQLTLTGSHNISEPSKVNARAMAQLEREKVELTARLEARESELAAATSKIGVSPLNDLDHMTVSTVSLGDSSAFNLTKLVKDKDYASHWNRDAAVTNFRVNAEGKVVLAKVAKSSQTINVSNWVADDKIAGLKNYDGSGFPSRVTCIVLPDGTLEKADPK